jgi:hypothetical protein
MSTFVWLILLVGLLTVLGSATLFFITVKYSWGERGTPPPTGDKRRRQKDEEMRLRAQQLEFTKAHPRKERSQDFFDNRKRG